MKNVIKNILRAVEIGCLVTLAARAAVDLVAMARESGLFACGDDEDCGCRFMCCGTAGDPDGEDPDCGGPCEADFDE